MSQTAGCERAAGRLAAGRYAPRVTTRRRGLAALATAGLLWFAAGGGFAAAAAPPPGPPFPDPVLDQAVYDYAEVFSSDVEALVEVTIDKIETQTGAEVAVYSQVLDHSPSTEETESHARALMNQWGVGQRGRDDGLVILFDLDESRVHGQVQLYAGAGFSETFLSDSERQSIFDDLMLPLLRDGDLEGALIAAIQAIHGAATGVVLAAAPPAGPPFPDPVLDQAVYDYAEVLTPDVEASVEATIDMIETRTAAEVAVYTQVLPYAPYYDDTYLHAVALMDQWGVGRRGLDDGLVILFDLDDSRVHGQVQLYAGAGFKATFLTDSERQSIFDDEMLPRLKDGDLNGALIVAIQAIDEAATPEHAKRLEVARTIDAILGLFVAPAVLVAIVGWAMFQWLRFGRDPIYLDDPSIHMPAPPPELTPAAGAVLVEGGATRRALTTAMLDIASRGGFSFREQKGLLGGTKIGIELDAPAADPVAMAQRERNRRRPLSSAETYLDRSLHSIAGSATYLEPDDLLMLGSKVPEFDEKIERHVTDRRWMTERPAEVTKRWRLRGTAAIVAAVVLGWIAFELPISGLLVVAVATALGGVAIIVIAGWMPAVTMPGAMLRAMLAAYRRTLEKTMAQARSMQQVIDEAKLPWLETPDQAVVWGTALGLHHRIEKVLERSVEDVREGRASVAPYFPVWYAGSDGSPVSASSIAAGGAGGLFSSSALPDFGGMMSTLGNVGNSPSSSGGGGGFGGGGGGGGGGAGGGF